MKKVKKECSFCKANTKMETISTWCNNCGKDTFNGKTIVESYEKISKKEWEKRMGING